MCFTMNRLWCLSLSLLLCLNVYGCGRGCKKCCQSYFDLSIETKYLCIYIFQCTVLGLLLYTQQYIYISNIKYVYPIIY